MMRTTTSWTSMFLGFVLALSCQAMALDGQAVLAPDSVGIVVVNLKGIYQLLLDKSQKLNAPENTLLREILTPLAAGKEKGKTGAAGSLEDLAKALQAWDAKAPFRPTGGLWVGFGPKSFLRIVLEASLKPKEVKDFLAASMKGSPDLITTTSEENHVVLSLPGLQGGGVAFTLDLRPEGARFGIFPSQPETVPAKEWEFIVKNAADPDSFVAAEIHGPRLIELLRKNGVTLPGASAMTGETPLRFSWKNQEEPSQPPPPPTTTTTVSPLAKLQRIRVQVSARRFLVMGAMADPESKGLAVQVMNAFATGFKKGLEKGQGTLGPTQWAAMQRLYRNLTVVDRDKWVGLVLEEKEPGTIMAATMAIIGGTAAVAIPNFRKARDQARRKACFANQRVLLGSIEMYNMDNTVMIDRLDPEMFGPTGVLVKGKYLKSPLLPPDDQCRYKSVGDLCKDGHLECEFHGRIPDR